MKAVDPHLEGVKPLFEMLSVSVVEVTAQSDSREGSQIAVAIDEKRCVREIMFLGESMQKRSCWVGTTPAKQRDIEQQFCLDVYCSVYSRPLAVDLDSGFVNRDPRRRRRRRVAPAVSQPIYPVPDRSMRPFYA